MEQMWQEVINNTATTITNTKSAIYVAAQAIVKLELMMDTIIFGGLTDKMQESIDMIRRWALLPTVNEQDHDACDFITQTASSYGMICKMKVRRDIDTTFELIDHLFYFVNSHKEVQPQLDQLIALEVSKIIDMKMAK